MKDNKGAKEIKFLQMKQNKGDQELTFLQVKGSKGDKESKLLQMKGNKGVKEIKSLQTWDITVHVKQLVLDAESRFLYPNSLEKWILKSIGHKWRDYKCLLKGKGYDDDTDINTLYDNCPDDDVDYDQWVSLVNFWRSEEGKRRSNRSKESLEKAKVKPIHTTGTKSHARVREDMNDTRQFYNIVVQQHTFEVT
ncbi:hypothetical protein RDABS01_014298, partial [Bienertia sinuspersici]